MEPGREPTEETELMRAVKSGQLQLVQEVVTSRPIQTFSNKDVAGALAEAARADRLDICKCLGECHEVFAGLDPLVSAYYPALKIASWFGHMEIVEYFTYRLESLGWLDPIVAAMGHLSPVSRPLDPGRLTSNPFFCAVSQNHIEVCRFLMEHGFHADSLSAGWSALHVAAASGNVEIMKLLIVKRKESIDCRSLDNLTPLIIAAVNPWTLRNASATFREWSYGQL